MKARVNFSTACFCKNSLSVATILGKENAFQVRSLIQVSKKQISVFKFTVSGLSWLSFKKFPLVPY